MINARMQEPRSTRLLMAPPTREDSGPAGAKKWAPACPGSEP